MLFVVVCTMAASCSRSSLDAPTTLVSLDASSDAPVLVCAPLQPTSAPQDAFGDACSFSVAGSTVPVLAAVVGKTLLTIDHRGSVHPIHTFFADAPDIVPQGASSNPVLISRGSYVLAAEEGSKPTGSRLEIVIASLDGSILARHTEDSRSASFLIQVVGTDAGLFAYQWRPGTEDVLTLMTSHGDVGSIPQVLLATDPGEDGVLGVLKAPVHAIRVPVYWLDPCSGAMTRSREPDLDIDTQFGDGHYINGSRIIYYDRGKSTLVDEGPHDVRTISVPDMPPNAVHVQAVHPSGWVLFTGVGGLSPWVTANASIPEKHVLTGDLPPTFTLLNLDLGPDAPRSHGIDVSDNGDVTVPLRNANAGVLFVDRGNTCANG